MVGRGKSYSVMMTCVALPLGRGNVLSGKFHVEDALKLIVLNHSACARCSRA